MALQEKSSKRHATRKAIDVHLGDCVKLKRNEGVFQVIGLDAEHNKCWVRQWPLLSNGSPVFEAPIKEIVRLIKLP